MHLDYRSMANSFNNQTTYYGFHEAPGSIANTLEDLDHK
jgi:hypothetical protein